jgi:hypothetical protein
MNEKPIVITTNDAMKIKAYVRETLKIIDVFAAILTDERIDESIRKEYDLKFKGIDL